MLNEFEKKVLAHYGLDEEGYSLLTRAPSFSSLPLFEDCPEVEKTIARLQKARSLQEKVIIYGDYDTDGVMATSITKIALERFGLQAATYLPSRYLDGYGINLNNAKKIVEAGYQLVICVDNGVSAYEAADYLAEHGVDLLIIDVMMPGLDGVHTVLKIRENSSIPIIMLSAKGEDNDKILGLNIGADDYLTKPYNPLELVARVKSQLRRYTQLGNMEELTQANVYTCGGLVMDDDTKDVTVDGNPVKLTPIEYNILLLLVKNAGKVFSIDEIYTSIWNEEAIGADNTVAVHIRHIREKIEINPREPRYLKVVWGVGYKIEKQENN